MADDRRTCPTIPAAPAPIAERARVSVPAVSGFRFVLQGPTRCPLCLAEVDVPVGGTGFVCGCQVQSVVPVR